uniref:WH2 domain-containing protein n=1 Tax=Trichobilharzia regenti TaxID=157069 RepID=A0AA85KLI0_TRIRE|nr:unnamed protein product [Trichobilharzia regenti]
MIFFLKILFRFAKRSLDDSSFYGGFLHVCYAPEFETIADCRLKLYECRRLNARISRKAEHDYREKFTRTCESSTSEPVPAIPSTSNQAIPQSLDVCPREFVECQSLPMNTDTISSCTPFLSHDNPTMHQINETVSYPPCDALDDSRLYWKQFGTQLPDQNQLKVNPTGNSNMSPAIITHNISHPSASNHHHPQSGDLSTAQKRPIPLPVLQALSCRPYLETTSKADKPLPTAVTSETSQQVVQYSVSSFVPRILNDTIRMRNIHTKNPKASLPASGSSTPISVGELKRLAHSLGPEQGPSLPPPPKQKKVHDDGVNNTKRIVFHRTKLKQKDGYTPTCEEN